MFTMRHFAGFLLFASLFASVRAQAAPILPTLDDKPTPQVDAGGPSAAITSIAFTADGKSLYAAGLDKMVHVWELQKGKFIHKSAFRVPIGPGNAGGINAVAVSPDGAWIAMAGRSPMRGEAGFRQFGVIVEAAALSTEQIQDAGVIYVASTANPAGGKVLRGHRGEVRALQFVPGGDGKQPILVSAATERDGNKRFGGLRLWDVATGKSIAERNDLPAKDTQPGLAAWRTGEKAIQVAVAVAWPEVDASKPSLLRLWNAEADALQAQETDRFTRKVVLLAQEADRAGILTGGFGTQFGRLRIVPFSAKGLQIKEGLPEIKFAPNGNAHYLPVSLAVMPAEKAGVPQYAVAVLQPSINANFQLALVDLIAGKVVQSFALEGSDRTQLPQLATSKGHIAVAAFRDHGVRVYSLEDLLAGKGEPKERLTGESLTIRQAAFVEKGSGLWLSEVGGAGPLQGGVIFDFDKREVKANNGAKPADDTPKLGDWSFAIDPDKKGVNLRQGATAMPPVRFSEKDAVITAVAFRPPGKDTIGVLAVAYTERDARRTLIALCDPTDGKPRRVLVSHLEDVRELAFSASRPLLASVADDQTVCIWSLADLDHVVGKIVGLGVGDSADKQTVVTRVEPNSPAATAKLLEGDVLEKLGVPGGEPKLVKNAGDFLVAVSTRKPGDTVEITVKGKAALKVPVARGVDERKPLFSLLLLRTANVPEWVGWSPVGPYDYSSPAAEKRLGWHTNTGDEATPVSYVAAREHSKEYYRKGILGDLATEGNLNKALEKWNKRNPDRPPQPTLHPIRPEGATATSRPEEYLVRQAVKALRLGINDDYALDDKHVLRWRLTRSDDGALQGNERSAAGEAARDGKGWKAELPPIPWKRGEFRLRLGLHARADGPELISESVMFRYQPPAPTLEFRQDGKLVVSTEQKPLVVRQEKMTFQAVLGTLADQEVEIRFDQFLNGRFVADEVFAMVCTGPGEFPREFKIPEGLNRLTVRAINKGALVGFEAEESATAEVWVNHKAPADAPLISELRIDPEPEPKLVDGKQVWVASQPAIRLIGKISAMGTLAQANWSAGGVAKSLLPAKEAQATDFAIDLNLEAGKILPVRLFAKSKDGGESTTERQVAYHPSLPNVVFDPLAGQEMLTDKLTLTGTFQSATNDSFEMVFRINSAQGTVKRFKPVLDKMAGKWKVELSLFPGGNSIETLVSNEWRSERAVGEVLPLNYRRPPRIAKIPANIDAIETNKVKLELTIEEPAGRPLTAIKVDAKSVKFNAGKPTQQGDLWVWNVELPEVFVNDGTQNLERVSIIAATDEGESQAALVGVTHKMKPRPPIARFINPMADDQSAHPEYRVTYRIESEKPLERVQIESDGKVLHTADLKLAEREGVFHILHGEAVVSLKDGSNILELIAVNADGRSPSTKVVLGYKAPDVLVSIDQVEIRSDQGKILQVLKPDFKSNGDIAFPTSPRSLVWLSGRVRWNSSSAPALEDNGLQVTVRVGDCRQFPVALEARGQGDQANQRSFNAPLVLIGDENRIKIEVSKVGQQEQSRREFDLTCAAPAKNQRLHVLIVGVNVKDSVELKKRVLDALNVSSNDHPLGSQGEFAKKPPFERCIMYQLLVGEVTRSKVEGQLGEINLEIERLQRETGWLNDLVLIYYQGADEFVSEKNERYLKTSRNYQLPNTPTSVFAIPCNSLSKVPGSQLLLLNVPGSTNPSVAQRGDWGGPADVGLMRYAFHDKSEERKSNPTLLAMLKEAIQKQGRVDDVVQHVNGLITKNQQFSPLIVLDQYQASRRISEPAR
ncbi:MAG: hypothetical protein K8T89_06545 [Planctomycetes bacterium]|nr:hypothetical protein [Planctomycetota bacterium]